MRRTRSFTHSPHSVTDARRFAAEALPGTPAATLDVIALLVSELASNSVRHTDSGFDLTIISSGREIRVEATDRGTGEPQMRSPAPTDPSGRGLQIVNMLSADWGVETLSEGKTVWFTVAVDGPVEAQTAHVGPTAG
jgi:serine/threonine-protein kinase RsbW